MNIHNLSSFLITIFFILILQSCSEEGSSSDSIDSTVPSWTAASTCSTRVIDYGLKGIVAGTLRGAYSDSKIIPGTSYPSIAYNDAGSITIKFNFWNGNTFKTEVVSGDGSGAFIRLAYLSTGIPIILWTSGGTLKAAIRSTRPGVDGTWEVGIIDSGTAPRAVEVSVNPLDQVGVVYLSDTAVAGRAKFLYCNSPCTDPSQFQAMVATPYIENTNITAAQVSTGIGWCKVSNSLYYPAVTYANSGATRFAICQRNTLSDCLNTSNWTPQTIVGTGNLSTKLLLDANTSADIPKVISLEASGLIPYTMNANCTAAPSAFSSGSAIGTSTSGNRWVSILKDSVGKFHIAANEGTASTRYYNSQTTNFIGSWNTSKTVENIAVPAATAGGADIDNINSSIYISYAQNAAPYDLRLGRIVNYTTASNSSAVVRFTPDMSGLLQLTSANAQLSLLSSSQTRSQLPAVAYVDYSNGTVASAKLKLAVRNENSSTSSWTISTVPGTQNPQYPSLMYDQNDLPWIGYFDAANNKFYLINNAQTDGSGSWNSYEFPGEPSGAPAALPAANKVALAMANNSGSLSPVMITLDNNATSRSVTSSMFNTANLTWTTPTVIETLTTSGASHLSSDYDSSGNIVVAYRDNAATRIKYVHSSNGTTWTTPLLIGSVGQGAGANIKINSSRSSPSISFFDRANNSIFYSSCSGSFTSCSTGITSQVAMGAGVSGLGLGNEQLLSATLSFSSTGVAQVAYPTGQGGPGHLFLSDNTTGSFESKILELGAKPNLTGTPAVNFGVAGWNAASSRNASDQIVLFYLGPGNWLYATSCGD